jgi:hypothetical protein
MSDFYETTDLAGGIPFMKTSYQRVRHSQRRGAGGARPAESPTGCTHQGKAQPPPTLILSYEAELAMAPFLLSETRGSGFELVTRTAGLSLTRVRRKGRWRQFIARLWWA